MLHINGIDGLPGGSRYSRVTSSWTRNGQRGNRGVLVLVEQLDDQAGVDDGAHHLAQGVVPLVGDVALGGAPSSA
jgi:hypothetical protein